MCQRPTPQNDPPFSSQGRKVGAADDHGGSRWWPGGGVIGGTKKKLVKEANLIIPNRVRGKARGTSQSFRFLYTKDGYSIIALVGAEIVCMCTVRTGN
jgi:hypothetical protein